MARYFDYLSAQEIDDLVLQFPLNEQGQVVYANFVELLVKALAVHDHE